MKPLRSDESRIEEMLRTASEKIYKGRTLPVVNVWLISMLSKWESIRGELTQEQLQEISKTFNIDMNELITILERTK